MTEMAKGPKNELPKGAEHEFAAAAEAEKGQGFSSAVKRLAKLSLPALNPEVRTAISEAGERVISLLKDAPGGIAALASTRGSAAKTSELREKVAEAATELAIGELSLAERKAYESERRHSRLIGEQPGELGIKIAKRSSEIMAEAYGKVDRVLSPDDRKNVAKEQEAITKWDKETLLQTAGARAASMPETPSSQFREQAVLDRLQHHQSPKQKY